MMKQQRRVTKAYFDFARFQYAPLIQKLAFQIGIGETHIEELKAQGVEELLKCIICYRYSGSFITFFYGRLLHIFSHMRDAENRARRVQNIPPDCIENMAGPDNDIDSRMMIQECLKCLSDDERNIITQIFLDEKTIREVSRNFWGVVSTIYRIKEDAISKMKQKHMVEMK